MGVIFKPSVVDLCTSLVKFAGVDLTAADQLVKVHKSNVGNAAKLSVHALFTSGAISEKLRDDFRNYCKIFVKTTLNTIQKDVDLKFVVLTCA